MINKNEKIETPRQAFEMTCEVESHQDVVSYTLLMFAAIEAGVFKSKSSNNLFSVQHCGEELEKVCLVQGINMMLPI